MHSWRVPACIRPDGELRVVILSAANKENIRLKVAANMSASLRKIIFKFNFQSEFHSYTYIIQFF